MSLLNDRDRDNHNLHNSAPLCYINKSSSDLFLFMGLVYRNTDYVSLHSYQAYITGCPTIKGYLSISFNPFSGTCHHTENIEGPLAQYMSIDYSVRYVTPLDSFLKRFELM